MIPFIKPYISGREAQYINQLQANNKLSGDGSFTKACHAWLENNIGCKKALLTNSCTAALEMAAILIDTQVGDEIIMPSFTFVSTANAFVMRGGVPVFVDIRSDTLNIDETKIEAAITPKTKAIVPVHYAGVSCEMDVIMNIAEKYGLFVIEDAAQAIMSTYKNRRLGTIGHLGALSFHDTKNIIAGEGGALLINDAKFIDRAEIIREKGTNRAQFYRGEVDKYTWVDVGSSFLPSELTAAFLLAQFDEAFNIIQERIQVWDFYQQSFSELEQLQMLRRPIVPSDCQHNGHLYYLLLPNEKCTSALINLLRAEQIYSVFHYVPLHSSPAGLRYARTHGELTVTDKIANTLLRLPLWVGMESEMAYVVEKVRKIFSSSPCTLSSASGGEGNQI